MENKEEIIYRNDQKPIISYTGGTMAVPAVPGAGKTFIIANLAAKLIEKKLYKPGKILIVTYMNSAVNNFKSRISSVLCEKGIKSNNMYEVMTIHSLALKILKDRPDIVGISDEFRIIDEVKQNMYLNNIIIEWRKKGGERLFKNFLKDEKKYNKWEMDFFRTASTIISDLKLQQISPVYLNNKSEEFSDYSILKCIAPIYEGYTKKLKSEGYIDYNDLLVLAYKAIKTDDKLREKLQKRYKYIFEDECQDSNLIQGEILEILSEKWGNLVRVGDVNQSITGTFTSSDPKFFVDFCKNVDKKYTMDMASRSTEQIIKLANDLVKYVREEHPDRKCRDALALQIIKPIPIGSNPQNPKSKGKQIFSYCRSTNEVELLNTIKAIEHFKVKNPERTIGVMVSSNEEVKNVSEKLRENGIECDELSRTPEQKMRVAKNLGYILGYIAKPYDNSRLIQLLDKVLFKEKAKDKEILFKFLNSCKCIESIIYPKEKEIEIPEQVKETDAYKIFKDMKKIIKDILEYPKRPMEKYIVYISDKLEMSLEDKAMAQAVASYVKYSIMDNIKLTLENISMQLLDDKNNIFAHIADVIYELHGYEPTPDRVTVCTYHKSKGLEWDLVFLLGVTEYNFPCYINGQFNGECHYLKENYKNPTAIGKAEIKKIIGEKIEKSVILEAKREYIKERTRLLYVAITRAKRYLIMSSHNIKKIRQWNIKQKPSPYFNYLSKKIEEVCK